MRADAHADHATRPRSPLPAAPFPDVPPLDGRFPTEDGAVDAVEGGSLRSFDPDPVDDGPATGGAVGAGETTGDPPRDPSEAAANAIPAIASVTATASASVLRARGRRSGTTGAGASSLASSATQLVSAGGTVTAPAAPVSRSCTATSAAAAEP